MSIKKIALNESNESVVVISSFFFNKQAKRQNTRVEKILANYYVNATKVTVEQILYLRPITYFIEHYINNLTHLLKVNAYEFTKIYKHTLTFAHFY